MSDPNVTITFSGKGEGAIQAAHEVGVALDSLAVKSKAARNALQAVGTVMDQVSSKSVQIGKIGTAYSQAANGINESVKASQRGTAAFVKMGEAAAKAHTQVGQLGKPSSGRSSGGGSGGGGVSAEAAMMGTAGVASLTRMAMQTVGVTVGLAAIGNEMRKLIGASSDLDSAMSSVAAVGALEKNSQVYGELIDLVTDLGGKTQYSATEAATGLKELIAAGYSATDAAKLLSDTLSLAATENMEMGRASEIVVASLQSFQMGVEQSTRVTDVLARAANASTASIDGMGEALKYLAPVANALKIPIEDAAAAVAIMSNNGVQAGLAGRGLSAIVARMIAPSKDAQEIMAKFGVTLADLNPQVVGLGGAFKNLQRIDTAGLVKLFGAENLDVSNIAKANADGFGEMVDRMKDVSITAQGMATLKNDNLAGDFKKAAAAVNLLRVELAKDLYGRLRKYVESFTSLLRNNKDEIVAGIKKLWDLVEVAGKVGLAFGAVKLASWTSQVAGAVVKTVELSGAMTRGTVIWNAETAAIVKNTDAALANRSAKAAKIAGGPSGSGATAGAVLGGMAGYNAADAEAGLTEKTAYVVGGVLAGSALGHLGEAIGLKLISYVGMGITKAKGVLVSALTSAVQFAAAGLSAASLGVFAAIAAGGASLIYNYDRANKAANEATDATLDLGNAMVASATNSVREAKTQLEFDKAKLKIKNDLMAAENQLAGMKRAGASGQDLQTVQTTIDGLNKVLGVSDAIFAKNQKITRLAAEEAEWAEANAKFKAEAAAAAQKEAVAMANMVEAAGKLKDALPDLGEKILGTLPAADQLAVGTARSGSAVSDTNALRGSLEGALAGAKVDLSLIDPNREIKTVDDVVAYYRAIIGAVQASGKGDLLGLDQVTALTAALDKAMAAKALVVAKQKEVDQAAKESAKTQQEIAKVSSEIAINEAKAAGDTKRADALEREKKILEEQARLVDLMGKGKEGEAKALAIRKVNAEAAANATKSDSLRGMAVSSLQEIGGGGRVFAGGFGDNKQVDLLSGILGVLGRIEAKGSGGGMTVQKL